MSYYMNGLGIDFNVGGGVSVDSGGVHVTGGATTGTAPAPAPAPSSGGGGGCSPFDIACIQKSMVDSATYNAVMPVLQKVIAQLQTDSAPYPAVKQYADSLAARWKSISVDTMTVSTKLFEANDLGKSVKMAQDKLAAAKVAAAVKPPPPKPAPKPAPRPAAPSPPPMVPVKTGMSTTTKIIIGAGVLALIGGGVFAATALKKKPASATPNRRRRHRIAA